MNRQTTAIVVGALIGAAIGGAAGWTYVRQMDAKAQLVDFPKPETIQASAGDFLKIGVALLGLLRMFDDLFKPR